jgi:hypothetical protein
MDRLRFFRPTLLVLALVVTFPTGRAQGQIGFYTPPIPTPSTPGANSPPLLIYRTPTEDDTCVIYSLKELGEDTDYCKWIAETIPQVIAPGSWSRADSTEQKRVLRYFAPKGILVVYHTPAVQAKVDGFLKDLKKTAAESTRTAPKKIADVIQAQFQERTTNNPPADTGSPYPVPAPAKQPKHLFHFIIRYEGEGIVDDHVADVIKAQINKKTDGDGTVGMTLPSIQQLIPAKKEPNDLVGSGSDTKEVVPLPKKSDTKEKADKDSSGSGSDEAPATFTPAAPVPVAPRSEKKEKGDKDSSNRGSDR